MNWSNVKLIFLREVRDQLRDRRTLFMIAVLPLLLYPLLGMSFFQVSQFLREQPTNVLLVGLPELRGLPPLVEDDQFSKNWLDDISSRLGGSASERLFTLTFKTPAEIEKTLGVPAENAARQLVQQGGFDAVVYFPGDFAAQLERFRTALVQRHSLSTGGEQGDSSIPHPVIYYNTANEKSQLAYDRIAGVLRSWADAIGRQNLKDSRLPATAADPFDFLREDVAEMPQRNAAMWSKILPFVLLIWALTGAFYPAIDLCAGEKERGTLETLLSSPAQRGEIVTGKLLTVMLFSIATSVLNLVSMGLTGALVISHLPIADPGARLSMPPLSALAWLLVALPAVAALFGALCLALAAFARSTKEGQYYLMPLVLVTMPLVILPMAPGVELNLGNSLIPLTGLVLLLRALLEGNYLAALPYAAPVVGVTLLCCIMAVRWAVDQFNKEDVLFRESERLDVSLWLRHLVRDRGDTPSVAEALFCGVLILLIRFFMSFAVAAPSSFDDFAKAVVVSQLVVILTPALLMTIMLTRSPRQTLLLNKPGWWTLPAAMLLAVALRPGVKLLQVAVEQLYPVSSAVKETLQQSLGDSPNLWSCLLLLALLPAICEELAFRGFILSGFRHLGNKWRAIVLSSLFFAITHALLQQSLISWLVGAVIAYVAVQTGSIFPCMLFHLTHNSLEFVSAHARENPHLQRLYLWLPNGDYIYAWWLFGCGSVIAVWLLFKFAGLTYHKTEEESLQEAIDHQVAEANA